MVLLETWSDWSKSYYIKEDHSEEEETAGDAVNNQSRGGVGEDIVRHVGVTSSEHNNKYINQTPPLKVREEVRGSQYVADASSLMP